MQLSSFFNSINKDRLYKAEDWAAYFSSFIGNGVFPLPSDNLQVMANAGMVVTLKAGKAWINGYFYRNTGDLSLQLANADGVLKRIDRVVIRWSLTDRKITAAVKSSTPSANPVAPALQRDADAYELCVADIMVGNGVTSIGQQNITDQRLNTDLCGIVAAVVNQIDTTTFNVQLQAWFAQYRQMSAEEYQAFVASLQAYENQITADTNAWQEQYRQMTDAEYQSFVEFVNAFELSATGEFNAWFSAIKDILGGSAAGNLLNMINTTNAHLDQLETVMVGLGEEVTSRLSAQDGKVDGKLSDLVVALDKQTEQINEALASKANASDVYTKTQTDNALSSKLDRNAGAMSANPAPDVVGVRNSYAQTTDLTAGVSAVPTGIVVYIYE